MRRLFQTLSSAPPLLAFTNNTITENAPRSSPDQLQLASSLHTNFSPSMAIIIIVLLAVFFLLALFTFSYRRRSVATGHFHNRNTGQVSAAFERPSQGLDQAMVDTLPLLSFSEAKAKDAGNGIRECVVCLGEFQDHETLRLLPQCNHAFHQYCIDMWLFSHTTCPLCRHSLLLDASAKEEFSGAGVDDRPEIAIPIIHQAIFAPNTTVDLPSASSRSKSRKALWRSKTIGRLLPSSSHHAPPSMAFHLDSAADLHRSRSYTEKESGSSKGLWRAFSIRKAFDTKRPAPPPSAEAASSSQARRTDGGYGDKELYRSRSYTAEGELSTTAESIKAYSQRESGSNGSKSSWKAFSFRKSLNAKRLGAPPFTGPSSSSEAGRLGSYV